MSGRMQSPFLLLQHEIHLLAPMSRPAMYLRHRGGILSALRMQKTHYFRGSYLMHFLGPNQLARISERCLPLRVVRRAEVENRGVLAARNFPDVAIQTSPTAWHVLDELEAETQPPPYEVNPGSVEMGEVLLKYEGFSRDE